MNNNTNTITIRTNGKGIPRGWVRCAPRGSVYYWGKNELVTLKKYGSQWRILHMHTKEVFATGSTMVEAVRNFFL